LPYNSNYNGFEYSLFGRQHLNVLYYGEPNIARGGGVGSVAYYLPKALMKNVGVTYLSGIGSDKAFLETYLNVFEKFVKKEFDIIHFNADPSWKNGSATLLRFAKLRHARTVLNIHGIPQLERKAEQWHESVPFIDWLSTLSYCNLADRIVVNSEFMRNNVVTWYRLNRDKVVVIPNGVNLQMFTESNDRIMLEGDPSILYVGHLSRLKGVDILIRAVSKISSDLPTMKLHLVGNGNAPIFAALLKKEGIEKYVVFHNWAKPSKIPSYYKSADICVFPSRHEGFGIVILEAMASGTPVIASDIPSFREIISDSIDGRLFKSQDADALAKEVVALYRDPHLMKKFGQNALEKVKNYSWEKIAEKYISLYEYLCK
jgi:glycosyltransferase involved in cell wall biosynthesis